MLVQYVNRPAPFPLSVSFLIASLYGNGEQGAFYVPKPQYLFQDAEGTTPVTAPGDPVGLMLDLSGNDNHATQAVSGERPVYRTDGTLHWLEFDGVDDTVAADLGYNLIPGAYMAEAAKRGELTSTNVFSRIDAVSGPNDYLDFFMQSNERLQVRARALSQGLDLVRSSVSAEGTFGNARPYVLEGQVYSIPGNVTSWIDGVEVGSAASIWPEDLVLGAARLVLYGHNSPSRLFFGGCYMRLAPSQAERSALLRYLANLAGVSLDD